MRVGRRLGVDHGVTFHVEPKLRTVLWGWLGASLDETEPGSRSLVVADGCLGVRAPYLVQSTTTIAFEDWQVGFVNLVEEASVARTVLRGGAEGRRVADELGVRYVVVDPRCSPDVEAALGGAVIFRGDELLILELSELA